MSAKSYLCGGCNNVVRLDQLDDVKCPYCGSAELEFIDDTGGDNQVWAGETFEDWQARQASVMGRGNDGMVWSL